MPSPNTSSFQDRRELFITRVCEGTLEYRILIDYIIDSYSKVTVDKMKPVIREILRSAVYQIRFMDSVPDSAVCNEAVKLAQRKGFYSLKPFVNGVLRTIAREWKNLKLPSREENLVRYLSVRYSMPETLVNRWLADYGEEKTEKILADFLTEKPITVRCRTHKFPQEEIYQSLIDQGVEVKPAPYLPYAYEISNYNHILALDAFIHGKIQVQDVSSMLVAEVANPQKGDYIIDMCAAPGGKATALGAALNDTGFLLANDISTSRARALLRNLELFGMKNMLVTDEKPAKLAQRFPAFFNKILLDAPCSGEGMFRKEEALARDWTPEKSAELSDIQKDLVLKAADMLRPGGMLLYSTCTFSPCEDEEVVAYLLRQRPDMELMEMPGYEGFSSGRPEYAGTADTSDSEIALSLNAFNPEELQKCVRIFPHKMDGEGHFLALFRKKGDSLPPVFRFSAKGPDKNTRKWLEEFFSEIGLKTIGGQEFDWNRVEVRKDKVYYQLPFPLDLRGISFLRNGLYLGDLKKNRFEPSQPLALALHKGDVEAVISLPVSDERLTRYLKGETLMIEPEEAAHKKGWHLLCVDGYPLGFGKLVNGILKNKYPAGWRV